MAKLACKLESIVALMPVHIRQIRLRFSQMIADTNATDSFLIGYRVGIDKHLRCMLSQCLPATNTKRRERQFLFLLYTFILTC